MTGGQYYLSRNNQKLGPFSSGQLRQLAAAGMLRPEDHIWKDGASKWMQASQLKGLSFPASANEPAPAPVVEAPQAITPAPTLEEVTPAPPPPRVESPARPAEQPVVPPPAPTDLPAVEEAPVTVELASAPAPASPETRIDVAKGPAPTPAPAEPQFHRRFKGQSMGPIPLSHLKNLGEAGYLAPEDYVWQVGTPAWVQARDVAGLFPAARAKPPQAVPPAPVKPLPAPSPPAKPSPSPSAARAKAPQAPVQLPPAPAPPVKPAPSPAAGGQDGPHPVNNVKVADLIVQLLQADETLHAKIAGEQVWSSAMEWVPFVRAVAHMKRQPFVIALTSHRLLLFKTKKFSFAQVAWEWSSYPRQQVVDVACYPFLLGCKVVIRMAAGPPIELENVPRIGQESGPKFAEAFRYQGGQSVPRPEPRSSKYGREGGGAAADFMTEALVQQMKQQLLPDMRKGFIEGLERTLTEQGITDPATRQQMLEEAVEQFEKSAEDSIRKQVQQGVREGIERHRSG